MRVSIKKRLKGVFPKPRVIKTISVFLAFNIFLETVAPLFTFAVSGGPSQPEVQGFTPIGTSDMVDPFTGDFTYNIPLMDVDGYPINISYRSGVTMDQEAGWVGLGWSLNPGVVNRGMRGIPDDFNGDQVVKEFNIKDNSTYGFNAGIGAEAAGIPLSASAGIGVKYNNYTGLSIEKSFGLNLSIKAGEGAKGKSTGGLGLNCVSSSDNGLTISPNASFSFTADKKDKTTNKLGTNIGCSYNSRTGMQSLSYGVTMEKNMTKQNDASRETGMSGGVGGSFNFGLPTYSPQVSMPMHNTSGNASLTLGGELFSFHGNVNLKYYYSHQKLETNEVSSPAYGYINSDNGQNNVYAMHDFNREKEGSYNVNTVALPITNYTYDVFSVSGQGVGGSYRPFRSEMGHVFDPIGITTSDSWSAGIEVGAANIFHGGVDVNTTDVYTVSGDWNLDNDAASKMNFKSSANYPLFEKCYFKEANEKSVNSDNSYNAKMGGYDAVRVKLDKRSKFDVKAAAVLEGGPANVSIPSDNYRLKRERRNQAISIITRKELNDGLALNSPHDYNLTDVDDNNPSKAKNHHIAEITALNTSGQRYVYGIAAYNLHQEETSFAVSSNAPIEETTGSVFYNTTGNADNSIKNENGVDNYYSSTKTPAYAHSYLLTAVLSPDYVDSDGIKGPSDGDIGNYTKLDYEKVANYQWRTPMGKNSANYNEGLKTLNDDNKASYTYGVKDLWYLKKIETKNYIAIFTLTDREDGYGVTDRNGEVGGLKMKKLDKISLYSKQEYLANPENPTPIKEVHFEYDYSLCQNIKNNLNSTEGQKGKLTLNKIWFSYGKSNKAALSPYKFIYDNNIPYNPKSVDRWGNYKPSISNAGYGITNPLPNAEFPYSEQNKTIADQNASAWLLKTIELPSGGTITVDYESDDYAFVQNKQAMQMYKVKDRVTLNHETGALVSSALYSNMTTEQSEAIQEVGLSNGRTKYRFKLEVGPDGNVVRDPSRYLAGVKDLYFRFLIKMSRTNQPDSYEYVSGYTSDFSIDPIGPTDQYGWIDLGSVKLKNSSDDWYSSVIKAGTQFGRLNLSKQVWDASGLPQSTDPRDLSDMRNLFSAIINSGFFKNIKETIKGPNFSLFDEGVANSIILNKSWVRLNNVSGHKVGGGTRVKRVFINDEWNTMTANADGGKSSYGQEYSYNNEDGTSSGVAAYEPQIGGDENPWKQPVYDANNWETALAPDDDHYVETPFGECFFPSPSVGYSRVTIKNVYMQGNDVKYNNSGSVVHEFYTAKDFPTIVSRTGIYPVRDKNGKFTLTGLFKLDEKDFSTVSQGYVVEQNDMHGKPKGQKVYQHGNTTPISTVSYAYQCSSYNGANRLDNTVKAIYSNGTIDNNATIGVFTDFVSDFREEYSRVYSSGINANLDFFAAGPIPIPPIIAPIPSSQKEVTQFRSAVVTKVVQRFGILKETIATDLGSTVATKNLAYDAETGDVLVTQTTTNFNDKVYSVTFPAYWHYDGMGAAYKNIGFEKSGLTFTDGFATVAGAQEFFAEGDELSIDMGTSKLKAWVDVVELGRIHVIDDRGTAIAGNSLKVKVIRSGRRNQQSTPMATITMLANPLDGMNANFYDKVLQASAIEYSNSWKTYCDCFKNPTTPSELARHLKGFTTNPFVLGTKGMYKANKSYLYLAGRTQANYDNNTDIRNDGQFTSFNPYYRLSAGKWVIDPSNWTFTSEVTEFSPFGAELENRDALGHYSAAVFGYNQSLATAVAANSRYKEVGFDNFEDYGFNGCADNHFKFNITTSNLVSTNSHSGKYSVKVTSGQPVTMTKSLVPVCACDISGTATSASNFVIFKVAGGKAPYQFTWTCADNDVSIVAGSDGNSVIIEKRGKDTYDVIVTVVDRNGCTLSKTISIQEGMLIQN